MGVGAVCSSTRKLHNAAVCRGGQKYAFALTHGNYDAIWRNSDTEAGVVILVLNADRCRVHRTWKPKLWNLHEIENRKTEDDNYVHVTPDVAK